MQQQKKHARQVFNLTHSQDKDYNKASILDFGASWR